MSNALNSGHYRDESEIISAGLRLLIQQEKGNQLKIEILRVEAQKGLDAYHRGEYTPLQTDDDIKRFMDKIAGDVDAEMSRG